MQVNGNQTGEGKGNAMSASPHATEQHASCNEDQHSDAHSVASSLMQVISRSSTTTSRTSVGNFSLQLTLEACLLPWLDSFFCCTTQWGLVTDVRDDGTTFQRHGVVVEVSAEISTAVEAAFRRRDLPLQRLRQAIDLVKLALAVDPLAIKSLLMRRARSDYAVDETEQDPCLSEEELVRVTRGNTLFELRLRLDVRDERTQGFRQGMTQLMQTLDEEEIDASDGLRRCLVERVLAAGCTRRLLDLPVSTVLTVSTFTEGHRYGSFFILKKWAMQCVKTYQDGRDTTWVVDKRHAPLTIKRTEVRLRGAVGLDRSTRMNARALVREGPRVFCSVINIDARLIQCDEADLQLFLDNLTRNAPSRGPKIQYEIYSSA